MNAASDETPKAPAFQVISQSTTPEEVAAILAVLAAAGTVVGPPKPSPSRWTGRHRAGWTTGNVG